MRPAGWYTFRQITVEKKATGKAKAALSQKDTVLNKKYSPLKQTFSDKFLFLGIWLQIFLAILYFIFIFFFYIYLCYALF